MTPLPLVCFEWKNFKQKKIDRIYFFLTMQVCETFSLDSSTEIESHMNLKWNSEISDNIL